ncbi:MAG: hypothetical protein ABFS24_14530, partial [Pseudomonadota bacterium]
MTGNQEMIPQTTHHGLLMILFSVMGVIELWLWKVGHANQYGLYIGLAFILGAIVSALQYIKYRRKA